MEGMSYQNPLQESLNKYLYNGKELQDDLGLDWYDYGARMYDPTIGRWSRKDPMIEFHFNQSPYAYVYNNPMNYIDPFGLDTAKYIVIDPETQDVQPGFDLDEIIITPNDDDNDDGGNDDGGGNNDDDGGTDDDEGNDDADDDGGGFINYLRELDRLIFSRSYKDNTPNVVGNSNKKKTRSADAWERWVLRNTDQNELNDFLSYWGNTAADPTNSNTVYVPSATGNGSVTNPNNKTDGDGKPLKKTTNLPNGVNPKVDKKSAESDSVIRVYGVIFDGNKPIKTIKKKVHKNTNQGRVIK
jgi:RHS repeat-associated protein